MAAHFIAPVGVTTTIPFCSVSTRDDQLFAVRHGVPIEDALGYAASMLEVAKWLALEANAHRHGAPLDGLMHCLDASKAVVDAVFQGLTHNGEGAALSVVSPARSD